MNLIAHGLRRLLISAIASENGLVLPVRNMAGHPLDLAVKFNAAGPVSFVVFNAHDGVCSPMMVVPLTSANLSKENKPSWNSAEMEIDNAGNIMWKYDGEKQEKETQYHDKSILYWNMLNSGKLHHNTYQTGFRALCNVALMGHESAYTGAERHGMQ